MIAALVLAYVAGAATVLAILAAFVWWQGRRDARHAVARADRIRHPQRPGGLPPLT